LIFSCYDGKTDINLEAENQIPKETFELMLYDVHLADAIVTSKIMKTKDNVLIDSLVYQSVFEKYNYSKQEFEATLVFYINNNMDSLDAICERVVKRFNLEKGNIH
jgi:hypothetical protein